MILQAILLFLSVSSLITLGFITLVKRPFDAMFFFLCFLAYRHIPTLFYVFGFDGGNPFFTNVQTSSAMSQLALIFVLFTLSLYAGYKIFEGKALGLSLFPDYTKARSDFMVTLGLLCLTIGAAIVAWLPLHKAGYNIFLAIHMVRNENFYDGISFLKKFVHFATMINCAYIVDLLTRKKQIGAMSALLILNLGFAFVMGGKAFIVLPLLFMALTYAVCVTKRPVRSIAIAIIGLLFITLSLQFIRITLVKEAQINDPLDYTYNALHLDVMDSNLVFIDVLGSTYTEETGESFLNGLAGVIPRSLWPDKPAQITVGGAFKRALLPGSEGGWPVFGYNQWFASFGWLGAIIGGLLSGWLLQLIQQRYASQRHDAFSVYIGFLLVLSLVSPTGIHNEIFVSYVFYVIPLALFNILTRKEWDALLPQKQAS